MGFFKASWNFPNFVLAFLGRHLDLWIKTFLLSLIGPAMFALVGVLTFSSSLLGFLGGGAATGQGGALAGGLGAIVIIGPVLGLVAMFMIFLVDFTLIALIMNRLTGEERSLKAAFGIAKNRKLLIVALILFFMFSFGVSGALIFVPVIGVPLSYILQVALLIGFYFGLPAMVLENQNPFKAVLGGVKFFIKGFFYVLSAHLLIIIFFGLLTLLGFIGFEPALRYLLTQGDMTLSQNILLITAAWILNSFFYTFLSTLRCACILAYDGELEGEGYSPSSFKI